MKVAFATPRRPDGGRRDHLWQFCSSWWTERFPTWPIHEADAPGTFNRGVSINLAAADAGDWDVLVIIDGDVIAEADQVQAAVDRAHETGRLSFAFTDYRGLSQQYSSRVLAGDDGDWSRGAKVKMANHVSSILAVPRALWDLVGGFDERLEGWGHDDIVFTHVCRILGGGCERIPGTVWHLWHPESPHRAKTDPDHAAAGHLGQRYYAAHTPAEIQRIIAERSSDGCALVVITDGRRDCIERSVPAALENLKGLDVVRTIICDDSGDIEYRAWLQWRFPDAEIHHGRRRGGFAKAVRRGWDLAIGTGLPWVFWLEDDFIIDQPIDLAAMADVMTSHPHLTQIVLRRQPWFPKEIKAGGIIEMNPGAYTDHADGEVQWVEHQLGHWTNPHLVSRRFLTEHTWPDCPDSEAKFSRQVMTGERRSAFWGARTDPPTVEHVGERHGTGY